MKRIFFFIFSLIISGCSTQLSVEDLNKEDVVGVLNEMPKAPHLTAIEGSKGYADYIVDFDYKEQINVKIREYLAKKGYESKLINRKDIQSYYLVIEVTSCSLYKYRGAFAYGIHYRINTDMVSNSNVYICTMIHPFVNGKSKWNVHRIEELVPIELAGKPASWNEFAEDDKNEVHSTLMNLIDSSIEKTMSNLGI